MREAPLLLLLVLPVVAFGAWLVVDPPLAGSDQDPRTGAGLPRETDVARPAPAPGVAKPAARGCGCSVAKTEPRAGAGSAAVPMARDDAFFIVSGRHPDSARPPAAAATEVALPSRWNARVVLFEADPVLQVRAKAAWDGMALGVTGASASGSAGAAALAALRKEIPGWPTGRFAPGADADGWRYAAGDPRHPVFVRDGSGADIDDLEYAVDPADGRIIMVQRVHLRIVDRNQSPPRISGWRAQFWLDRPDGG